MSIFSENTILWFVPHEEIFILQYIALTLFLDSIFGSAIQQDEGEMDHAGHGCLLSAVSGHDLLFHMAVSDAKAEDR